MKRFILAIALTTASCASLYAGNGITKSANDSAITAGHQAFAAKISLLQSSLTSSNMTAAQTAANDILNLMQSGMVQGMARINLESTVSAKAAANKKYLSMETARYEYKQLVSNLAANGTQLVSRANDFLNNY